MIDVVRRGTGNGFVSALHLYLDVSVLKKERNAEYIGSGHTGEVASDGRILSALEAECAVADDGRIKTGDFHVFDRFEEYGIAIGGILHGANDLVSGFSFVRA